MAKTLKNKRVPKLTDEQVEDREIRQLMKEIASEAPKEGQQSLLQRHPSSSEIEDRLEVVTELIMRRAKRQEIVDFCQKRFPEWGVATSTIWRYIKVARKNIRRSLDNVDIKTVVGINTLRMEDLYVKCMAAMDYPTALRVLKEMNRLYGVDKYVDEKIHGAQSGQQVNVKEMSFEQLMRAKYGDKWKQAIGMQDAEEVNG